ncbi:C-8 sterol isomerase [Xylariomycetidae sp. FL2044]|nr:C-8 sterol isomerase [Xylariomycetidae sp. FL2044]
MAPTTTTTTTTTTGGRIPRLLVVLAVVLGLLYPVYLALERNLERFYIFELDHLHDLSRRAVAAHGGGNGSNDTAAIVRDIVAELHALHPDHVNPNHHLADEWFFNNAGGAMGGMYIIHASITEYLIIFGSAVGTEGHSGRHTADDYFHILTGEQWAYAPSAGAGGSFYEREVYPAGSVHHMRRGDVKQYRMPDACFALEYARGWIPPMMFFGLADALSSTLDLPTVARTVRITAREMLGNLAKGKF